MAQYCRIALSLRRAAAAPHRLYLACMILARRCAAPLTLRHCSHQYFSAPTAVCAAAPLLSLLCYLLNRQSARSVLLSCWHKRLALSTTGAAICHNA
jgi:hypothetical protein